MKVPSQLLTTLLVALLAAPLALGAAAGRDPWVHPRGDTYDATRHYRGPNGELFYLEENDVGGTLGPVQLHPQEDPRVRVELGPDLMRKAQSTNGALLPVLLFDSNGDGQVDRSVRGRLEGDHAYFELPEDSTVDLRVTRWQLGIRYQAGQTGDSSLDGRYLASVDSGSARLVVMGPKLPPVATPAPVQGLVILEYRAGEPFDFAEFTRHPTRFAESFTPLTRAADDDSWTVEDGSGQLRTHFGRPPLLLVRTTEGLDLGIHWGDVAADRFLEDFLQVVPSDDGCYSTLSSEMRNEDGSATVIPTRILYCPEQSVALFDVPNGYEIELAAIEGDIVHETTHVGAETSDNFHLYLSEVWRRNPRDRATGSVLGNVRAGFADAGRDSGDAFHNIFTGSTRKNQHSGRTAYRPSPVTMAPIFLKRLFTGKPGSAFLALGGGLASAVDGVADVVSAVDNGVVNPLVQASVGAAFSPDAADTTTTYVGAATLAVAKNLPSGERSRGLIDPRAWRFHDRAWVPSEYTRTDTQLNIDRVATILDLVALNAIRIHNSKGDRSAGAGDSGSGGGGGGGGAVTPPSPPPGPPPGLPPGPPPVSPPIRPPGFFCE